MEAGQSAGSIKVIGAKTIVNDGTNLLASGMIDGGKIETSGDVLNLGDNLNIDAKGKNGKAGEWLLDPLDVIIADSDPTGSYDSSTTDIRKYDGTTSSITGDTTIAYHDPAATTADAASTNTAVTWINSKTINDLLNNGTDVKIQAAATNGVANITVNSAISKTAGDDATFTLEAMRNITINKDITSSSGKLNVVLNSDTNGNQVGAVIINADIDTHGGNFISASGGNLVYSATDGTKKGYDKGAFKAGTAADPNGATVGTYFGHIDDKTLVADGLLGNRSIKTEGGFITLNGEVAIGLAGGTLTLDSTEKDSNKKITNSGDIKVTGIINSGNSYTYYIKGTDAWNNLLTSTKDKDGNTIIQQYLNVGTVPSYHYKAVNYEYEKNADGSYKKDEKGNYVYKKDTNGNYIVTGAKQPVKGPHYTYSEVNTEDPRWTANKIGYSTLPGDGWTSFEITGTSIADSMTVKEFLQYYKTAAAANFKAKYSSIDLTQNNAKIVATIKADSNLLAALTSDINDLLSVNWFAAKTLAQGSTNGGSGVNDTYLATITTILENSLTAPNGKTALFVGGRGSGVRNKTGSTDNDKMYPCSYYGMPDDPTYQNGMYWVTGPEGEVKNSDGTTGTQFYSNVNSNWANKNYGETVYGYANWATWTDGSILRSQPDNNSPFLTVGYGTNNQWDDVAMGGGYGGAESAWAKGFVQEKNLQHSSLNVQAGNSAVNLQGNIGGSEELDTVKINTTGSVTTGGSTVTDYNMGTINADHGVTINGGDVMIGGRITTGSSTNSAISNATDNVSITSAGNLKVHGITADGKTGADGTVVNGGKISLVSDSDKGIITIEGTTNSKKGKHKNADGTEYAGDEEPDNGGLIAGSSADGAVVIDSRGKTGAFVNKTTGDKAIDTKGNWQVYVASPSDYGTILGDNLNSETNAQWSSESTNKYDTNAADKSIQPYTNNTSNKFIFQVTPTITVSGQNMTKVYGDTLSDDDLRNKLTITSATFTDSDGVTTHDVDGYSNNFQEASDKFEYIASKKLDTTSTGKKNISVSSGAQDATATRTDGYKESSTDNKKAIYLFNVGKENATGLNGYGLDTKNADIEIIKRKANITGTGTQTYGGEKGKFNWKEETKENIADGSTVSYTTSIKPGSSYTNKQGDRNTANHGTYNDSVSFDNLKIRDFKGNDVNIADNYDLTTTGTIKVDKAKLVVNTDGKITMYGNVDEDYKTTLDNTTPALNGDKAEDLLKQLGLTYKTDAYSDSNSDGKNDKTNHVKYTSGGGYDSYTLDVSNANTLNNYDVTVNDSTVTITPARLFIDTKGDTKVYGYVKGVTDDINKAASIQGGESSLKNGDALQDILKELNLGATSEALTDNGTKTNHVKEGGYDINPTYQQLNDYTVSNGVIGKEILTKAKATVKTDNITTDYGTVDENYHSTFSGAVNGDDPQDLLNKLNLSYKTDAYKDATHTADVKDGGYLLDVTKNAELQDYETDVQDATVTLNKKKITVTNEMTQTYGDPTQTFRAVVTPPLVNDDKLDLSNFKVSVKEGDTPYQKNRDGRTTADVGEYADSLTYEGGGIVHADGSDSYENYDIQEIGSKIIVNPAPLVVKTDDVTIDYGTGYATTVGKTSSSVGGLRNGDENHADDLVYAYGNYGKDDRYGYLDIDGGKRTNNIGDYGFTTSVSVSNKSRDFLKNYTISGGDATLTITPKNVYFHVDGTGKTIGDVVYTVTDTNPKSDYPLNPNDPINSQLVYGETVTPSYRPDGVLTDGNYGVITTIDGKTITDGNVYDNYRYHYDGDVTLSMPNKPDFEPPVNPPVTPGTGTVTPLPEQPTNPSSNTPENTTETTGHKTVWDGDRGGDRPEDKRVVTLPFFKVLEDKTTHRYGTYDVAKRTTEVKIEPSAQVLPEPNQPATQYRELTTELTTDKGTGEFTLKYNGSRFTILPDDDAAMKLIVVGDETKNRALFEKALHVAFTQMGLEVADLDGVYIHFGKD